VNRWSAADVSSLLEKMKAATMVKRGDPGIKTTVEGARDEMNRFVAYYRRNNKVAGAASFSTLYTAISTLSGHFQNYGPEYPVPAKRQKVAFPPQASLPKPPFLRPSPGDFRLPAPALSSSLPSSLPLFLSPSLSPSLLSLPLSLTPLSASHCCTSLSCTNVLCLRGPREPNARVYVCRMCACCIIECVKIQF
jgi:hypothetical protein